MGGGLTAVAAPAGSPAGNDQPGNRPVTWEFYALCRTLTGAEMDDFTGGPDTNANGTTRNSRATTAEAYARAKAVCRRCPVRIECLQDAYETGEDGVRGGLTKTERDNRKKAKA